MRVSSLTGCTTFSSDLGTLVAVETEVAQELRSFEMRVHQRAVRLVQQYVEHIAIEGKELQKLDKELLVSPVLMLGSIEGSFKVGLTLADLDFQRNGCISSPEPVT